MDGSITAMSLTNLKIAQGYNPQPGIRLYFILRKLGIRPSVVDSGYAYRIKQDSHI